MIEIILNFGSLHIRVALVSLTLARNRKPSVAVCHINLHQLETTIWNYGLQNVRLCEQQLRADEERLAIRMD